MSSIAGHLSAVGMNVANTAFENGWNPGEDKKIFIKHHFFIYKKCMLEKNFNGVAKIKAAKPFRS